MKKLLLMMIFVLISHYIFSQSVDLKVKLLQNNSVEITIETHKLQAEEIIICKSTSQFNPTYFKTNTEPISRKVIPFQEEVTLIDEKVADGVVYNYLAVVEVFNNIYTSEFAQVETAPEDLPELRDPYFLIDKSNYILEVHDGAELVKTYPIALGRNPVKRKMNQDNQTTPEGIYTIYNLQPNATYYKAFDINYPNAVDRVRYNYFKDNDIPPFDNDNPSIGGEIQIHGWGIHRGNWTFGCMALENEDMDELFEQPNIRTGITAIIIGSEFDRDDIPFLLDARDPDKLKQYQRVFNEMGYYNGMIDGVYGPATGKALAKFQADNYLVITCDFDKDTTALIDND